MPFFVSYIPILLLLAVIVDAKDDNAIAFYRHHGFLDLNVKERTLFVPLSKFAKAYDMFDI